MAPPFPVIAKDFKYSTLAVAAGVAPLEQLGADGMLYSANLCEDWCIGVVPNGGYLTTVILNATTHYFTHHPEARRWNQPHAIHCALTFSTRCSTGPCTVRVTLFKAGRQYSIVRVALLQQDSKNVCIDATVTHTNMSLEAGATLPTRGMRMYYGGGGNDCATASGDGASGGGGASSVPDRVRDCEVQHDHAANFRRASKKVEQMFPRGSVFGSRSQQPSIREQWVALRDGSGAGFGLTGLGFVNDIFRSIPENYDGMTRRHWYPTLSLSLELKALPPPGRGWEWLFMRVECHTICNGRMDLDVVICDEEGTIVAVSKHMALVVDVSRNSIKGGEKKGGEEAKL